MEEPEEYGFEQYLVDPNDEEGLAPAEEAGQVYNIDQLGDQDEEAVLERGLIPRAKRSQIARMTDLERVKILITRSLQLQQNAPTPLDLSATSELQELLGYTPEQWLLYTVKLRMDPAELTRLELRLGLLDSWEIRRVFPDKTYEIWLVGELRQLQK